MAGAGRVVKCASNDRLIRTQTFWTDLTTLRGKTFTERGLYPDAEHTQG